MLKALQMCGANLDDYLHLLVPQIVKAYDLPDNPVDLRRWAGSTFVGGVCGRGIYCIY